MELALSLPGIGTARLTTLPALRIALLSAILAHNVTSVDCAKLYGNEKGVGIVLAEIFSSRPSVSRDQLFIASKLWNDDHHPDNVLPACKRSLADLQLDYLDLYLIHWPMAWRKGTVFCPDDGVTLKQTWQAMEKLVDMGLVRQIGLSNFDETRLREILSFARLPIYCNQIELHPFLQQNDLLDFCTRHSIRVIAWSPLAKHQAIASNPCLIKLAQRKSKTLSQIILRWHLQRGVYTIPRSSNPNHIGENCDIHGFELSQDEMNEIASLDAGKRLFSDVIGIFDTTPKFPWFYLGVLVRGLGRIIFAIFPNRVDLKAGFKMTT